MLVEPDSYELSDSSAAAASPSGELSIRCGTLAESENSAVSTADATAHYVSTGFSGGLAADTFDEYGYIASHTDLISAFGADADAAVKHFINFGSTEGRTVSFDAASYLAAHADLRADYGTDQELAKKHYIEFGSNEGRTFA